jgi:hypothetical protein
MVATRITCLNLISDRLSKFLISSRLNREERTNRTKQKIAGRNIRKKPPKLVPSAA